MRTFWPGQPHASKDFRWLISCSMFFICCLLEGSCCPIDCPKVSSNRPHCSPSQTSLRWFSLSAGYPLSWIAWLSRRRLLKVMTADSLDSLPQASTLCLVSSFSSRVSCFSSRVLQLLACLGCRTKSYLRLADDDLMIYRATTTGACYRKIC